VRLIRCVGAVTRDDLGRLLLIKRGHEPGRGLWSLPGGRVEPGESDAQALIRELREETGLSVEPGELIGNVRLPGAMRAAFDVYDYLATVTGGTLQAGDDAADVRWASAADLTRLELTEGLLDTLTGWGVLDC
jgi:ADP-ribose pyrophosphatase YjhB (NUDIX family)